MKFIHLRLSLFKPLVAALSLASCASFGGIASSQQLARPESLETAATLPAQGGQWPDSAWAQALGGFALQELIDEAVAGNPGMHASAARVAAAQAAVAGARSAFGPGVDASYRTTYQRYTENGLIPPPLGGQTNTDNQVTLNFSYDFDFWGKNAAALRSALSQDKAAQAEQYASRLLLASAIARTWVQLGHQYEQLDLVDEQLKVRQEIDRLNRLRLAAGLDTQAESEQARQQVASLRAEQEQWQEAIALSRNQLAALLGQGPDRGLRIARPVLPAAAAVALPDALPLALVGRRPDIVAARWRVEAAQGDIENAKAQFYPNVNLMAFAGFSSLGLSNLFLSGSRIAGIGPAIQLPVFESGRLRAQLKGRTAAYDSAVASYNQALTDALHEVADQVQTLRTTESQIQHQHSATEAAQKGQALARQRERAGLSNMLPALSAQMALLSQRRAELDTRARRLDARVALIKALGGGFEAVPSGLALPQQKADSPHATLLNNTNTNTKAAS